MNTFNIEFACACAHVCAHSFKWHVTFVCLSIALIEKCEKIKSGFTVGSSMTVHLLIHNAAITIKNNNNNNNNNNRTIILINKAAVKHNNSSK